MTLTREEFGRHVADLYQHLYDLVYLRTHPLTGVLVPNPELQRKDKAWQLHELLLDILEELNPGPAAPAFSREWRRHRLLVRRYKNGADAKEVMQEIAVSRRQYYREHDAAVEAVADMLWDRLVRRGGAPPPPAAAAPEPPSHLELLRLEAARAVQAGRYTGLDETLRGVLALLDKRLQQRRLAVDLALAESAGQVFVEKGLLRQMLLGLLGYLIERAGPARLRLAAEGEGDRVRLTLAVEPPAAVLLSPPSEIQERLLAFEEMAGLSRTGLQPLRAGPVVVGFTLSLPAGPERTILVVDDNDDILAFFQRLLSARHYQVITTASAAEALELASRWQPQVITLDLMMPGQDGWDLLQTLLNRPETAAIPIIVCSVLKQKELALSLGATAFLEKPFSEQALLATLAALQGSS